MESRLERGKGEAGGRVGGGRIHPGDRRGTGTAPSQAERGRWGRGVREVDAVRLAEALADGVEEKEDTGHLLAF